MPVLPADTARAYSDEAPVLATALQQKGGVSTASSPRLKPILYRAEGIPCQEGTAPRVPTILRISLVRGAVSLTDYCLNYLRRHNIEPQFIGAPESILQRLEQFPEESEILVYPIWTHFQFALDFARDVRRNRERNGAPPSPRVLILSFVDHLPITVQWFQRTNGTKYSLFTSEENLPRILWAMRREIEDAKRTCRLHLRFVHSGNPLGVGCIPGEKLIAAYGSFTPGHEEEIPESKSVLRFINLLALSRWRFRSASELVDLMGRHPLYQRTNASPAILSVGSIKTYISRSDDALSALRNRDGIGDRQPTVIAKERRGGKEIAYRLLCTAEVEHI
jgi:hypothetical protein